jgi:hypothetical protein
LSSYVITTLGWTLSAVARCTDHGRPSHVLMSYAEYERLTGTAIDLAEWLALDAEVDPGEEPLDLGLRVPDL